MSRSVGPWIGKHDDEKVPVRVRLRVFEAYGGRCWLSGRKIMPGMAWDLDHKVALINGGRHEEANLAPALKDAHQAKTALDVAIKAKVARQKAKHLGIYPKPVRRLQGRGFQRTRTQSFGHE